MPLTACPCGPALVATADVPPAVSLPALVIAAAAIRTGSLRRRFPGIAPRRDPFRARPGALPASPMAGAIAARFA